MIKNKKWVNLMEQIKKKSEVNFMEHMDNENSSLQNVYGPNSIESNFNFNV